VRLHPSLPFKAQELRHWLNKRLLLDFAVLIKGWVRMKLGWWRVSLPCAHQLLVDAVVGRTLLPSLRPSLGPSPLVCRFRG